MAKRDSNPAAETLAELDTLGDRLASWTAANIRWVLTGAGLALALAAGTGLYLDQQQRRAEAAFDALAQAQTAFRDAMGAPEDSADIPEPANPETARAARTEAIERYRALAEEHAGTVAATVAWLEAGSLQEALGELDPALATWSGAVEGTEADQALRGILLERIAGVHEAREAWSEAAEAHEQAADVPSYPLRWAALGEAARCWVEAGEPARALAAFDRLEAEAADHRLPDHVDFQLRELRAKPQG
ncbi:MAG: hypothetical protein MJE66_19585 [Proteobacteria bacterium]|nr:hypothetical protein [Pseudomonadota bacterium]